MICLDRVLQGIVPAFQHLGVPHAAVCLGQAVLLSDQVGDAVCSRAAWPSYMHMGQTHKHSIAAGL